MKNIEYLDEWIRISSEGNFKKAQDLYYDKLFINVIEEFEHTYGSKIENGSILFSILGFSPEPIILTAKAIKPKLHIIFTTEGKMDSNNYIEQFLESNYKVVYFKDESFQTIYRTMKEQFLYIDTHNSQLHRSNVIIDITGGKKSMVASASIFGKDYGASIVYVDFKEYIPELRKPKPGSEILNVVYNPLEDQPEIFLK
ncbi:hypothetical protein [Myroides profundi]|uniref:CRISPR-associated protein (Cas_Cas02710) n=1 Tax=Myroides profundi TaxID=480520 RepID=A0AAJ5BE50_MYRPR|nr:hypothetical protein [Myroides profundi]AJH14543.1 hypothetical protein MPR_1361 [Myroides profundi]SEQ93192.1 CRISPR-associated protein (Cas_Cas02710) [Myroides profundi]